jgi:hypothetical protein
MPTPKPQPYECQGLRTAEMEQLRKLVRELRAGAKRLVAMT